MAGKHSELADVKCSYKKSFNKFSFIDSQQETR